MTTVFKATTADLRRLSAEELFMWIEMRELLIAEGSSEDEAEEAAYITFFTK